MPSVLGSRFKNTVFSVFGTKEYLARLLIFGFVIKISLRMLKRFSTFETQVEFLINF
jgi:Fe2+ transport system protein FeoA